MPILVVAVHIIYTKLTNLDHPRITKRQLPLRALASNESVTVTVSMTI